MESVHENIRFILTTGFILLGLPELIDGWVTSNYVFFLNDDEVMILKFQRPFRIHNYNLSAYSLSDKVSINASIINLEGVSLYINVKKNIERPFIRFEIYVDSGKGITDLKYLNETVDMCRFFKNKTYLPFIQILYRILVDQGNYPSSCPIKKVNIDPLF